MRVGLAPLYRLWMWLLLPTTLGVGTAVLWLRSLTWPHSIDTEALVLRSRRKVPWGAIRAISVQRHYGDDRASRIDISYRGGRCKFPVRALQDGDGVVAAILAMFKQTRRTRTGNSSVAPETGASGYDNPGQISSSHDLQPTRSLAHRAEAPVAWDDPNISGSNSNDHSVRTHTAA